MPHDNRPIGVFDSGIGGLTVLRELKTHFPNENYLYLGDTARLPYGTKSPSTVRKYSEQNIEFLAKKNVKAVIIACNTASSYFLEHQWMDRPIYNVVEPGAMSAIAASTNKRIGVLGTRTTIQSQSYNKAIERLSVKLSEKLSDNLTDNLSSEHKVFSQACPLFVPLAEEGWIDDPITNLIAYRYVHPLLSFGIDTLILGCTHYPILKNSIRKVVGQQVHLIDSGQAIAQQLERDLQEHRFLASDASLGQIHIYSTDLSETLKIQATRILNPHPILEFGLVDL